MEYSYHNVFLPDDPIDLCKYIGDENIFKLVFKDVSFDHKYRSPLRENDSSPGCFFWETPDSRIMFVDYGNLGKTHFTSIEFIKEYFKLKSIHEALVFINDKLFCEPYGITKKQLIEDNVIPVKYYKIIYDLNNFQVIIPKYETYAYNFADGKVKFYTPKDKVYKWYTNATNNTIGNIENISKKGYTLIITKSYKDVMVLKEFGIQAVCLSSESTPLTIEEYWHTRRYCDFLVSLLDYDKAGIRMANYLKKQFGIKPLMLTRGRYGKPDYGVKDISDFRETYGKQKTLDLINKSIEHLSDFIEYSKQLNKVLWK